jgi:hypothetical protein
LAIVSASEESLANKREARGLYLQLVEDDRVLKKGVLVEQVEP